MKNVTISYIGKTVNANDDANFLYVVTSNGDDCNVNFNYLHVDESPTGKVYADVDISAGGDGVSVPNVQKAITAAWDYHIASNVASDFIMNDTTTWD